MKFGDTLKRNIRKEYATYYIAYDDLKYKLKKGLESNDNVWSQELEEQFLSMLEDNLNKIYQFFMVKKDEILRRINEVEHDIRALLATVPKDAEIDQATEEEFSRLGCVLNSIDYDVDFLYKYSYINLRGFKKIIKKHDKQTHMKLNAIFTARLDAKPFFKFDYGGMILTLSELHNLVNTRGNPVEGDAAAGGKQQDFVRQTTKYWVHPDNITEVKLHILQHMPVLVFNSNKEFDADDSAITSIYFDNADMDLYYGRLRKDEGAEAHRLRWYGSMDSTTIFVERKTHREDWTGESSVKQRFHMKEKHVNDFLKGNYDLSAHFKKALQEKQLNESKAKENESLAREIQYTILSKKLRPVMRSFYHRTAFQLPGDARVRISLDTELTLVREDNFDGFDRTHNNWRRLDIGVDWPFNQVDEKDICRFPYAVLEVKLQTQFGQEPPAWIRELISSHLVEAVPKFSKFLHGCATLLPNKVDLIPFWLPQIDVDIKKPKIESIGTNISRNVGDAPGQYLDEEEQIGGNYQSIVNSTAIANNEQSENAPLLAGENNENILQKEHYHNPLVYLLPNFMLQFLFSDLNVGIKVDKGTVFLNDFVVPKGKKIWVPIRIEPKVYFATERTYLLWLSIAMFFGATGTTLLNYSNSVSGIISSAAFFISAILIILYSMYVFIWRSNSIRHKDSVDFIDNYGPWGVCMLMMVSTVLTFVFKAANEQ